MATKYPALVRVIAKAPMNGATSPEALAITPPVKAPTPAAPSPSVRVAALTRPRRPSGVNAWRAEAPMTVTTMLANPMKARAVPATSGLATSQSRPTPDPERRAQCA